MRSSSPSRPAAPETIASTANTWPSVQTVRHQDFRPWSTSTSPFPGHQPLVTGSGRGLMKYGDAHKGRSSSHDNIRSAGSHR